MSSRFASEQLTGLRLDARRLAEQAGAQEGRALAVLAVEDVNVASRTSARAPTLENSVEMHLKYVLTATHSL
jgi:hypothetical protein